MTNPKLPEQVEQRLLSKKQVLSRVPVSFPTLWLWMQQGKFPRSRKVGAKTAWLESEVTAWIEGLPIRPLKGDTTTSVSA